MSRDDSLRAGAEALGLELSQAQSDRLLAYADLILKWNKVYNLTALRDPAAVLSHHLFDSLAVLSPIARQCPAARSLLDVGSGAGLPGVVISIMRDDLQVNCLDAVAKKAAFVQQVASELRLPNLRGIHGRVEQIAGSYQLISSRAFAALVDFVKGSETLLAPGGVWMAMKGRVPDEEIAALPSAIEVFHVEQLRVPTLEAERCIVWMRKRSV